MEKILPDTKLRWMRYFTSLMLFLFLTGFYSTTFAQSVTITTDKDDYLPGEWVIITGTGWQGDDSVKLTLTHLDPLPDPIHTHDHGLSNPIVQVISIMNGLSGIRNLEHPYS